MDKSISQGPEEKNADALEAVIRHPRIDAYPLLHESIIDNAKRSVSVRISTSDYGRLKSAARRLRVRESDVFRHALRIGLARLLPLFEGNAESEDFYRMIARVGIELGAGFRLDTAQGVALLRNLLRPFEVDIQEFDLELIYLAGVHPKHVQYCLEQLNQCNVEEEGIAAAVGNYLTQKYRKCESPG